VTEPRETQRRSTGYYRRMVNQLGKKQFTFLKMIEYGFWPKDIPTPYEQQENETKEAFLKRKKLMDSFNDIIDQISELYKTKGKINDKLRQLREEYAGLEDIEKIRKQFAKQMMEESIKRREERKKQREIEKKRKSEAWKKKKKEEIVFVGNGYSSMLYKYEYDSKKLKSLKLPIVSNAKELAKLLDIEYKELRFLAYHRDVVTTDHYTRYKIPKRNGGLRSIAAPKTILKRAQRAILDKILSKIEVSPQAHGFLEKKSVITSAKVHPKNPHLLINMDIKDFFPTITFERIRGIFLSFGYSGHISTLLSMICSFCERIPIEVEGEMKYVATTKRILPQGSPASPMITNIICRKLDRRLMGLAEKFGFNFTRYADDMSFSTENEYKENLGRFCGLIYQIVEDEDFKINKEKNRFLRENNQQNITGIVINSSEIGVPRKWIKNFRAAIYNAKKLQEKDEEIPKETLYELSGMASWVKSVNSKRYKKILDSCNDLIKDQLSNDLLELNGESYPKTYISRYKSLGKIPVRNDKFTESFKEWFKKEKKSKSDGG